jgi:hypothetical protein
MISLRALGSRMSSTRKIDNVERAIYLIRGQRVMLDSDLAAIYQVTTKRLNEQLRRNRKRFPADFAFHLRPGGRRYLEPAEPTTKREIGFHVRERAARYRTKRRF